MPKLFLIRHAIAEDRILFQKTGLPDEKRPLTADGKRRMKKISKKFYHFFPDIDLFCQSPLLRSQQTVKILRNEFIQSEVMTIASLSPESPVDSLINEIKPFSPQNMALIGHENHLSECLHFLLTKKKEGSPYSFKKGGIACLHYTEKTFYPCTLEWLITPKLWLF